MVFAGIYGGAGTNVPAEVVRVVASFVASKGYATVDKGVVVNFGVVAVEDQEALVVVDKSVAGYQNTAGYFKEEAVAAGLYLFFAEGAFGTAHAFDAVVDKNAVFVAHVVPQAVGVGMVGDEVFTGCNAVTLVEYFYGSREEAGPFFNVVVGDRKSVV